MLIPHFWAQAKRKVTGKNSRQHLLRFGWSNESQARAEQHAQERVQAAAAASMRGETVTERECKLPYNSPDGLPIREEIIAEYPLATLTRNQYGAVCLNSPQVLFADIDVTPPSARQAINLTFMVLLFGIVFGIGYKNWLWVAPGTIALAWLANRIGVRIDRRLLAVHRLNGDQAALTRIDAYAACNRERLLRVYKTPMGYRVLAMHALFDAKSQAATELFEAVSSDKQYRALCRVQQCFRARLTAKPWRTSLADPHIPHRASVWPLTEAKQQRRRHWVAAYQTTAAGYAACRYLKTFGHGAAHPDAQAVQQLHDEWTRALADLPLA